MHDVIATQHALTTDWCCKVTRHSHSTCSRQQLVIVGLVLRGVYSSKCKVHLRLTQRLTHREHSIDGSDNSIHKISDDAGKVNKRALCVESTVQR